MDAASEKFDLVYSAIKKQDGILWLRILGQTHWQYNELPFWVLIRDCSQIKEAVYYLQRELKPLQGLNMSEVTVSFIAFEDDRECSYGYVKGEEFFKSTVFDEIYDEPECGPRKKSVFDYEHPDDPWALKTTSKI